MIRRIVLAALVALLPICASAQVKQSGTFTTGHALKALSPSGGVVGDAGGATPGAATNYIGLSELGITATGTPLCVNDAATNSHSGYHQLCLGANSNSKGTINYNAFGGASAQGLNINLNGTNYSFPGSGNGDVVAPSPTATAGNIAQWNGGTALKDGGPLPVFNVMAPVYGAKCDGSTNDSAAISAAITAAVAAGGGIVYVPPTGHTCILTTGVSLGNGVMLMGGGTYGFPGSDASCIQRAAAGGTWLQSNDTTNPAVTLGGHGSALIGMNFCYTQPVPGGTFTPTAYGDTIKIVGSQTTVKGINIVGSTVGINLLYTSGSGGGTGVVIQDILVTSFSKCFSANFVNDNATIRNLQCRNLYYASNAAVVAYLEAHLIGMDIHYMDNPWIYGVECFQTAVCMQFTDDTILSNTHSLYNGQLDGIQCNLVVVCMKVAAANTTVDAVFRDLQAQGDTATGKTATLFQLGSDNVNVKITDLSIRDAGGSIMALGNGFRCTDGVTTNGSTAITSASCGFVAADVGKTIVGTNIPALTIIAGVSSATQATLSANATGTGSGITFLIGGGRAMIPTAQILEWSNGAPGQVGFSLATGAKLFKNIWDVTRLGAPGAIFAGAGASSSGVKSPGIQWMVFTNNTVTINGAGAYASITNDNENDPYTYGSVQARILGQATVTTPSAATSCSIKLANFPEIVGTFSTANAATVTVDTNYIDLTSADAVMGQVHVNCPVGVQIQISNLSAMTR